MDDVAIRVIQHTNKKFLTQSKFFRFWCLYFYLKWNKKRKTRSAWREDIYCVSNTTVNKSVLLFIMLPEYYIFYHIIYVKYMRY